MVFVGFFGRVIRFINYIMFVVTIYFLERKTVVDDRCRKGDFFLRLGFFRVWRSWFFCRVGIGDINFCYLIVCWVFRKFLRE